MDRDDDNHEDEIPVDVRPVRLDVLGDPAKGPVEVHVI